MSTFLRVINIAIISVLFISCTISDESANKWVFPRLSGKYLGQLPPKSAPEVFAPNIISTSMYTRDITISPDGKEIFFCVSAFGYNLIFQTEEIDGKWTEPIPATFIDNYKHMYYEPHLTADGNKLLFLSNMPNELGKEISEDIWAVDKTEKGWGEPYNLGEPVNTDGNEFFPSTTKDGTLYFTRAEKGTRIHNIYRSKMKNGKYEIPEKLGSNVNCGVNRFNAFIDPEENYIIVPVMGMKDSYGGTDYYIVFRDENDVWSEPINLGEEINTEDSREYSPYVSPDGKYFFFMSSRTNKSITLNDGKLTFANMVTSYAKPQNGNSDIFWIKSDFIYQLKDKLSK